MRILLALPCLVMLASSMHAQRIGEPIRVQTAGDSAWRVGLVVGRDQSRLHVWYPGTEMAYRISELERIEVWRERKRAVDVTIGVVGMAALMGLAASVSDRGQPATGDFVVVGILGGMLGWNHFGMAPACWKPLRE
jgi:hypothetical protein